MSKLAELIAQRETLEKAIHEARQEEIKAAVSTIRELVEQFSLTAQDIFPARIGKSSKIGQAKVAPKYINPENGATWTGRGKAPKWIEGKDRAQFVID